MRLANTSTLRYKLTGFFPDAGGQWRVRGFLVSQLNKAHTPANGYVNYAVVGGVRYPVVDLKVDKTELAVTYCSVAATPCPATNQITLAGATLMGSQLEISVPDFDRR